MITDKIEILKSQDKQFNQIAQVVDNLSNEWRQPISYLSSQILYLQTLQKIGTDKQVAQEVKKMLPLLNQSIEKMGSTVNLFSNFYSPNNTKSRLKLKEQVQNIVAMHNQKIILHNIEVEIRCDENLYFTTYKNSFDNLLMILFENSIESFESEGKECAKIIIEVEKKDEGVLLSFSDNGSGIEPNNRAKIFDSSFTTKPHSSGLGLAVANIIVKERLGGTIKLQSSQNLTQFEVFIR